MHWPQVNVGRKSFGMDDEITNIIITVGLCKNSRSKNWKRGLNVQT